MTHLQHAIVRTLLYSDIFDYPLTEDELWRYLLSSRNVSRKTFFSFLHKKSSVFTFRDGFYFLQGRIHLVKKRLKRQKISKRLFDEAKCIAGILSFIPMISFIGVSGSLAMMNCDEGDDIDFFIITKRGGLWITRLLVLFVLHMLGKRRKRGEEARAGSVCVNMWIDERAMAFEKESQDLYTAHEIVQMRPVVSRRSTYERFLGENMWVEDMIENGFEEVSGLGLQGLKNQRKRGISYWILFPFESAARRFQVLYMSKHRTTEVVGYHYAAFHPFDYKKWVLVEFQKREKKLLHKII